MNISLPDRSITFPDGVTVPNCSPGPFQEAVANMVLKNGVSIATAAGFFGISEREVSAILAWVSVTNANAKATEVVK